MKRKACAVIWITLWYTLFVYLEESCFSRKVLFCFVGCVIICSMTAAIGEKLRKINLFAWDDRITDFLRNALPDKALLFYIWFIILLGQIPSWLAYFPGIFGYDSPVQFAMYMGDMELTSANPLLHTWILGAVINLGKIIFGSYQAGFALFIFLQILLISNCAANMTLFLIRRRVPLIITLIGLTWTFTHPFIQILNINSTKDVLCGVFFAFFVMTFWEIVEEKGKRKISEYGKVFFFGLMSCLLRNAIIFLFVILLAVSMFVRLKDKKVSLTLLSVVICVEVFSVLCGSVFRIPKGDMRENLCIPIQQMATVIYMQKSGTIQVTKADMESLEELFSDMEAVFLEYNPYSVDQPKSYFRTDIFKSDPGKYISLYFRLGVQNPALYYYAIRDLNLPYWHVELNGNRRLAYYYTFSELNRWDIQLQYLENPFLQRYREWQIRCATMDDFPFWRQPGLCIWLLTALMGVMIARKEERGILKILPIALYFLGILMGPIALMRYLYPVMLMTPLLFGMLFQRKSLEHFASMTDDRVRRC